MVPVSGDWRDRGRCTEVDPELFFPERGHNGAQAKLICAGCEVRAECRAFALERPERLDGIWGGLTEDERRKLRREFGRAA